MKGRVSVLGVLFAVLLLGSSCSEKNEKSVSSPDGKITIKCWSNENQKLTYQIEYNNQLIIKPSSLGILMEDSDYSTGMKITASDTESVSDSYDMLYGKQSHITYEANQLTINTLSTNGGKMDIIFRVSNDGVAFRYSFPTESDSIKRITSESTSFNFDASTKAWLQPMAKSKSGWCETNPSYEEHYMNEIPVGTLSPIGQGWVFPALFKTESCWVLLTESGLGKNYCASRISNLTPEGEYKIEFPEASETWPGQNYLPESTTPWVSPWRVIVIGDLATVAESNLETSLAEPAIEGDFSWVKPGKASWSWVLLKDNNTTYPVQKEFIDYAANMGWGYCLIDAEWDSRIGYEKIAELAKYAETKGVGLLLWYNSSGPWNSTVSSPKSQLLTHEQRVSEFKRIADMGIKGIKVDFFGGDGQSMIRYYHELMEDAANAKLMINFHGCTYPRSWHRTYPNLVTMESIKGMEFITFDQANAEAEPRHGATLCFTRNVFSPMDFTPMALTNIPGIERRTTNAYELATAVLYQSGIQHYAETAAGMSTVDERIQNILRDIPALYNESKLVDGYPAKLAVMARRAGDKWYVTGVNGENIEKDLSLDLSFMGKESGTLINEGVDAQSFNIEGITISEGTANLKMAPNGGFLIIF